MAGIIDLFVPKEKKFFQFLDKEIILLQESSKILGGIVIDKKLDAQNLQKQIKSIQKKSKEVDIISREIVGFLHKTFITPIDREDIKSLSGGIGLITGSIKKISISISYLKIEKFDKHFIQQIKILQETIKLLKYIFEEPLSSKRNTDSLEQIKELERDADEIYRDALDEIFSNGFGAIDIIKKKELYQNAEDAIDDVRTLADLLETIIIVNS